MSVRVGRTAVLLAPLAILARGIAFLVPVVIARVYGATPETDAFFYALAVPSFTMVITVNAVIAVVAPAAAKAKDPDGFGGTAVVGSAALSAVLAAMLAVLLIPMAQYTADFSAETRALAQRAAWTLIPFSALLGATGVLRTLIELRGQFFSSAVGPLVRGGTVLATIGLLRPLGPSALPLAFLFGQAAEFAWQLAGLHRSGIRLRPRFFPLQPEIREVLRGLPWLMSGEAFIASNLVVDRGFAASLSHGAVSHLEYADRTRTIPQTFLESTLLPVASATWANHLARGDRAAYLRELERTLSWVAGLSPPALAALYLGRHVAVRTLYQHGAFGPEDATVVAAAFGAYVLGLWGMLLGTVSVRALAVEGRTPWVAALGLFALTTNSCLDAVLYLPYGVPGLAAASSITWTATGLIAAGLLVKPVVETASPRRWAAVAVSLVTAVAAAVAVEAAGLTPESLLDPRVLLAASPLLLSGVGLWLDRRR